MANGFFLGGAAEGMMGAQKQALAERTLADDTTLRGRGLDIQERTLQRQLSQDAITRADAEVANTMTTVSEIIKGAVEAGRDPAAIQKAVQPLVDSAKQIAARTGKNPAALDAQVQAQLFRPTTIEGAAVKGAASATAEIAESRTLAAAAGQPGAEEIGKRIKDPKQRVDAENSLRDDFMKQANPFVISRDFYSNFVKADDSGAGDITRVFAFMKMQDPNSAVLPGEAANAQNAAGVPEQVRAMYNTLIGGGKLSSGARTQLANQAKSLYEQRALQHDKLQTTFANIAKRQGLNPSNVIPDLLPVQAPAKGAGIPAPPAGFNIVR